MRHTRDGRNVLWHDPEWNGQQIATTNCADLVSRNGHRLACLEDVLEQFGPRAYLDIELKEPGGEDRILAALKATPPQNGFMVSSFLPEVLLRIRERDRTMSARIYLRPRRGDARYGDSCRSKYFSPATTW